MRNDLTEIILIVDRSGSMRMTKDDAEGGINQFIEDQKKAVGDANLTLVQFDDQYEFVHKGEPIQNVGPYSLVPRGMTALLDAVGKAIVETGERLKGMKEVDRPATVICMIVTDGHENSSQEYKVEQIREMIEKQQDTYKWHFNFLGADEKAFSQAGGMGISRTHAAIYDSKDPKKAHAKMSEQTTSARLCAMSGQSVSMGYTDKDRKDMK